MKQQKKRKEKRKPKKQDVIKIEHQSKSSVTPIETINSERSPAKPSEREIRLSKDTEEDQIHKVQEEEVDELPGMQISYSKTYFLFRL